MRRGEALVQMLAQDAHSPVDEVALIVQFYAFKRKILEILSADGLRVFIHEIMGHLEVAEPQLLQTLSGTRQLTPEVRERLDQVIIEFFREKKVV
jgi:F0F1-type ATP synthase alpha subunit